VDLLPALLLVASPSASPSPSGNPDPDSVSAGWFGFLGLIFLAVAVLFLWRSMNRQLTRITFDDVPVDPDAAGATQASSGTTPSTTQDAPDADAAADHVDDAPAS
jgi:hypothetical protein